MERKFDCIVAGGGLAGLSAATVMARAGLRVVVLERGAFPGAKSVMGGVIYRHATEQVFPEFWKKAPLERPIVKQSVWVLGKDRAVEAGVLDPAQGVEPCNAWTVLRSRFDRWLGKQATEAGVLLVPETAVTDVIRKDGTVIGVKTDREEGDLYADVTVAADGVGSVLARSAGLRPDWRQDELATAVKEVIALPREKIEDRFGLEGDAGATIELVGEATGGRMGVAFIYTNKDSLSVGAGVLISELVKGGRRPYEILDGLKAHPAVRRLVEGGVCREYMAHIIPEGGYHSIHSVHTSGMLVTGDAAGLVNSYHREGSNLAILSGKFAAETVIEAKKKGAFTASALSSYRERLEASIVFKDLRKYANLGHYVARRPWFFGVYPEMATMAAAEFIKVDGMTKRAKQWGIFRKAIGMRSLPGMIKDALGVIRRAL